MRLLASLLLVAASAGTALAQHARYPREQPPVPAVTLSDRVTLPPPEPVAAATRPTLDMDAALSIESLRTTLRPEQEPILIQLIANTPDSEAEEKVDYYFRLGELYAKEQRFWRMKAAELLANAQGTAAQKQQQTTAANKSKEYLLKAVKTFKGLVDNDAFRNYPKLDMALFYYAYTLQGGKYMKEARAVYDKLVKNYPTSKFVPEAHLAFGDYYFDAGQYADAEARYKQVLTFPKSSAYGYAMYKLGWVQLNLQRTQEAIATFANVVIETRSDAKQAPVFEAARADFVRATAQTGTLEKTVAVYRDLIAHHRGDANICEWQYEIARTTVAMPNATANDKVKEITALAKVYKSLEAPDDDCRANTAAMGGEMAAAFRAEWSRTKDDATLRHAEQLYAVHVGAFPDDADAITAYGEVLWARAERENDAKQRAQLWQRSAEAFSAAMPADGARLAVLAWMNALDVATPTDPKITLGKAPRSAPRARPLGPRDAKLVAALAAYEKLGPAPDAELAQMRLAVAIVLRKNRHFDDAIGVLDGLLDKQPTDPHAELAANLLLDSLIQAGRSEDIRDVVSAIAADTAFVTGKAELQKNLAVLRTRSMR